MQHTQTDALIDTAKELGLLESEFHKITEILGREPNFTEICIYSVMWSEHCSYKNSIKWLKTLPKEGPHMLVEAGEENAGLVDIGNGLGCAFKIESHNHPSALEPYQGAATGVGGINRDIFTMGARPIAQLNSLRFGDLTLDKTKWLLKGVVKGIGDYGNSFGVPVLGGEVYFDECYNTNPLVNAMSVGILNTDRIISATAHGEGNPVFIVGSLTGKDGIHGAAFASKDITEDSVDDLPSVQVGDPFMEKLLLEASLELSKTDYIVGMQDMGAAGITCSTSEMSAKTGAGMVIDLDKVPTRQADMQPFEILLSESQERMLVVVKKGYEKEVKKIFDKWDLSCDQIGQVTNDGILKYYSQGELAAEVPAESLVLGGGAPVYEREYKEPAYFKKCQQFSIDQIREPENLEEVALFLIKSLNIASKKWVIEQYDTMVGTNNMSTNFPSDAGLIKLKNSDKALAVTVDCNARYVYVNPEEGCAIAVAEAARNITCSGGIPSAITNCLNFGNPYNPEVYWQFVGAIKGMGKACKKFNTPVTGGNVSFYNQSVLEGKEEAVFPTPTIGMIGVLENQNLATSLSFQNEGDLIYLIGKNRNDIGSSEYLYKYHKVKHSPTPHFDLNEEYEIQTTVQQLIRKGLIQSAHDCSDGGLFITLCEKGFEKNLGFSLQLENGIRKDALLFGEAQSRVLVSVKPEQKETFEQAIQNVAHTQLGKVTSGEITVSGQNWQNISSYKTDYENALESFILEE